MTTHPVKGDFIESQGSIVLVPNESSEIEVDVKGAVEISSQFKNTDANNISLKIFPSLGLGYTTDPIKNITIVNNNNQIIKIETGYYSLKFQLKNNDTVNTNVEYFISVKK
ncbi:MAG TPA: hypothetical protein VGK06_15470 [Methanosarcina sp.]|jgi:hypothetical protein